MLTNSILSKAVSNAKLKASLKWAIIVLLAFYIFYIPSMSYTSKLNYISYFVLPLLGICSIFYLYLYKEIRISKIIVPLTLFIIFCLFAFISTLFGVKQFSSLPRLFLVILSGFVFYFSFEIFDNKDRLLLFVSLSMLAFVFFYFSYSFIFNRERLFQWIVLKSEEPLTLLFFTRIGLSGGGGPNIISSYFGTCAVLLLYLSLFSKRHIFKWLLVPYFICVFAGITTGSRQFIIAIVLCSIVLYFISIRKKIVLCVVSAAIIITFLILFMTLDIFKLIRDPILDGLGLLENSRGDKSASLRLLMQIEALDIGGNRLFFGYGANGFEAVSGWGGYAHNTYANLYVSFGVFGLILYLVPIVLMVIELIKSKSKFSVLIVALMIYYVIIGFFIVWYKDKIFFIVYGLTLYFYSIRTKIEKEKTVEYYSVNI